MKELRKIIVAGVGTAALVGGIGAGLAYADTPTDGDPTARPHDDKQSGRGHAHG